MSSLAGADEVVKTVTDGRIQIEAHHRHELASLQSSIFFLKDGNTSSGSEMEREKDPNRSWPPPSISTTCLEARSSPACLAKPNLPVGRNKNQAGLLPPPREEEDRSPVTASGAGRTTLRLRRAPHASDSGRTTLRHLRCAAPPASGARKAACAFAVPCHPPPACGGPPVAFHASRCPPPTRGGPTAASKALPASAS